MTAEHLFEKIPFRLPDGECRRLADEGLLKPAWFVYRCDEEYDWLSDRCYRGVSVHCPECEDTVLFEKVHSFDCAGRRIIGFADGGQRYFSGDTFVCPRCAYTAKVKHCSDISRYGTVMDEAFVARVACVECCPVIAVYRVFSSIDKSGHVSLSSHGLWCYALLDGKLRYAVGFQRYFNSILTLSRWSLRVKPVYPDLQLDYVFPIPGNLFAGTDAENLHLDGYIAGSADLKRCAPHVYLALWRRCRHIENLVTAGYTELLNMLFDAHAERPYTGGARYCLTLPEIDFRKKRPCEMLGLDQESLTACRAGELALNEYRNYRVFRICLHNGLRLNPEQLRRFRRSDVTPGQLESVFERGINPLRVLDYLDRQIAKYGGRRSLIGVGYLLDYWNLVEKCGEALTGDRLFPRDLAAAHDRQVERYQAEKNAALDRRIAEHCSSLCGLCFEDVEMGLLIRPCANYRELVGEGEALHHCVATYAEAVAQGRTSIFFIRRRDAAETPFYTLELNVKEKEVVQNRGLRNCDRLPEVAAFEKEWLEYIRRLKAV